MVCQIVLPHPSLCTCKNYDLEKGRHSLLMRFQKVPEAFQSIMRMVYVAFRRPVTASSGIVHIGPGWVHFISSGRKKTAKVRCVLRAGLAEQRTMWLPGALCCGSEVSNLQWGLRAELQGSTEDADSAGVKVGVTGSVAAS